MSTNYAIEMFEMDCDTAINKFYFKLSNYNTKSSETFFAYACRIARETKADILKQHYNIISRDNINSKVLTKLGVALKVAFETIEHTMTYAGNYNVCLDYLYEYCIDNNTVFYSFEN